MNNLIDLVNSCYDLNRMFDRMSTVTKVQFSMDNLSEFLHEKIAHKYPKIADEIVSKTLERYNQAMEYSNVVSFGLDNYTDYITMLQKATEECSNILILANDISTELPFNIKVDLFDSIKELNKLYDIVNELYNRALEYGKDNQMLFDKGMSDYYDFKFKR